MNDDRRAELRRAIKLIDEAISALDEAKGIIEECRDEEQEYFDNMPESLQSGDRGAAAQEAIDTMDSVADAIDNFVGEGYEALIEGVL